MNYRAPLILLVLAAACAQAPEPVAELDVQRGERHFLSGYPAANPDGTVNAVIEIPAGSTAKWEVDEGDGSLRWEKRGEGYRLVRYLPYPGNYGMIPRTLLPEELGGDGDPLDVIVLSPAVNRGTILKVRPIGVLRLEDGGERDDKILAVVPGTPLGEAGSLEELRAKFPGAAEIVQTWFSSYKGPGEVSSQGFAEREQAEEILRAAMEAYEKSASPPPGDSRAQPQSTQRRQ